MTANLSAVVARMVTDLARLRGTSEREVRFEYGVEQEPDHWAEDSPWTARFTTERRDLR